MKVRLKQRAKIWMSAGDVVEVSPADADFLIACGAGERIAQKPDGEQPAQEAPQPEKKKRK